MPSGVPIVAALDGTVRMARGDSTRGGCDPAFAPDANYVVLSHEGELETQYLHLESVAVHLGDKVRAGDVLGYSGKTGWACGSHLHFKLAQANGSGWNNPSIHARIKGYGDPDVDAWVEALPCTDAPRIALPSSAPPETLKVQGASDSSAPPDAPSAAAIVRQVIENSGRVGVARMPTTNAHATAVDVQPEPTAAEHRRAGSGATRTE